MIFTAVKFVAGGLAGVGAGAVAQKAFSVLAANIMPESGRLMKAATVLGGVAVGMVVSEAASNAIDNTVDNVEKTVSSIKEIATGVRTGLKNAKKEPAEND